MALTRFPFFRIVRYRSTQQKEVIVISVPLKVIKGALITVFMLLLPVFAAAQQADSTLSLYDSFPGTEFNFALSTLKVVLALGFTLVLLFVAVWFLKHFMQFRNVPGVSGSNIELLEMRYMGPRKSIALIAVAGRVLIVGITEQNMTTLGELSPEEAAALNLQSSNVDTPFAGILKKIRSQNH